MSNSQSFIVNYSATGEQNVTIMDAVEYVVESDCEKKYTQSRAYSSERQDTWSDEK